jgi:hypothetical protein
MIACRTFVPTVQKTGQNHVNLRAIDVARQDAKALEEFIGARRNITLQKGYDARVNVLQDRRSLRLTAKTREQKIGVLGQFFVKPSTVILGAESPTQTTSRTIF